MSPSWSKSVVFCTMLPFRILYLFVVNRLTGTLVGLLSSKLIAMKSHITISDIVYVKHDFGVQEPYV